MSKTMFFYFFLYMIIFFISNQNISAFENSIGMKLRVIPPGDFIMGSPKDETGREADEKIHRVQITKPFFMAQTETTQAQWLRLMDYNPSSKNNRCLECPVESVSWYEANNFIKKLNIKESTNKYRLPTEAEWEYACRAGTQTAFNTGEISSKNCQKDKALNKAGWYCGNSGFNSPYYNLKPHFVKLKKSNKFGLYDMHGNVMEWCLDSVSWDYTFSRSTGASLETYIDKIKDPLGKKGDKKIFRGGSFVHSAPLARSANRFFYGPKVKRNYLGFRIVKEMR